MSERIKVTFTTSSGISVERELNALWNDHICADLRAFHGDEIVREFKMIMRETIETSLSRELLAGVIDELVTKADAQEKTK